MMQEGPFVGSSHEDTQNIIITCATQRVPQCLQFTSNVSESITSTTCTIHKDNFKELPSQVGGLSSTKECIKLQPPYVLKPLRFHDDRWYRETAFYEAVSIVTATNSTPFVQILPLFLLLKSPEMGFQRRMIRTGALE